ncbi:hypothetical protein EBB59_10245 [Lysobacter pythonis]|uniref:Uncharacterized protein n=1 Tax=Solilutibacter pythonis TaxID=2483112 RepID=A0A3M2HTE4_9GAMM|nr:hypothetical protein EBB59_10245 [Lysobacter pythonis]
MRYPALSVALGYASESVPVLRAGKAGGVDTIYDDWNYALPYAGVPSLQDPAKTQNTLSHRVWGDPRKGRWMLASMAFHALGAMALGLLGAYRSETTVMNQRSLGLVAFGPGMVGLLETAVEMCEHHRIDRRHSATGVME